MSLYTKYRPKFFEDVAGQGDAVTYLKNIIDKSKRGEKIPHAYLFSGGHGIGKTTLARIFARELDSEDIDIYELDAASSSKKIDDMREIIDSVYTMPTLSKYKVYIFDEAHMLTKDSSNAFLKTLEEPPAHVIIILCTTDPEKLISTIRSRCNIINLKKPSIKEIVSRLEFILDAENIILNKNKNNKEENSSLEILNYIAENSNQSYRDSITNLEKVLHTYSYKIKENSLELSDIENIFGKRSVELYLEIFKILADTKSEKKEKFEKILSFCVINHSVFYYDKYLEYFRDGIILRNSIGKKDISNSEMANQNIDSNFENFVKENPTIFNVSNLLYFLEKSELYKSIGDKEGVLIAIFGNYLTR